MLLLFGPATLVMTADMVAVEASPLRTIAGRLPWYIDSLPLIGLAFVVAVWLGLRRWLGAWVLLLAYIAFLYAAMGLVKIVMEGQVESIPIAGLLSSQETMELELAVGEPVANRNVRVLFRRDPQVRERVTRWLAEHGKSER